MRVIVNSRMGAVRMRKIKDALALHFIDEAPEICYTRYGGHARVLAREAVQQQIPCIVAAGGDGTLNEVMQEMAYSSSVMGIIPTGSGNGLARHCGIPLDIQQAVALLKEGKAMTIDLGMANSVYFMSNAGIGFDAKVCYDIAESRYRGLKMYVIEVLRNYLRYKAEKYTLRVDGQVYEEKAFLINVANGREFGYGFEIAPEASMQDGQLDMIVLRNGSPGAALRFIRDAVRKKTHQNRDCLYLRARDIQIVSENIPCFQTDGDAHICDHHRIHFQIREKALNILVHADIKTL
ncbi:MAG TPA: diacylglycerol kinase family lipid kinase [Chitinophagaceae bacterium]|nr:diacylglycerol kinase family lipid kinase [Chitinophagaceae bacterium]